MIPGYLAGAVRDRPHIGGYAWRARAYPHAARAIERAEAEHGEPVPTCLCGGPVTYRRDDTGGRCSRCGQSPLQSFDAATGRTAAAAGPAPPASAAMREVIGLLAELLWEESR